MKDKNLRLAIILMSLTSLIFALQDGISRHLGGRYSVYMIVMIRFWFFAAFVMALAARQPGGIRAAIRTNYPKLQIFRGLLLVAEICVMIVAYVRLGLVNCHAVLTCYPLLVAALSGPVLGESVGWRRWTAIAIGFAGVLIVLAPGVAVFSPASLIPLAAAFMFALYGLLTRYVAQGDAASVSFFWAGLVGALVITPLGLIEWQPMSGPDWLWMALLCCTAASAHFMMIRALELAEASAVQPFAFLQLPFAAMVGVLVFGEALHLNVVIGAVVVVGAGLFTLWRARTKGQAMATIAPQAG
jgi:drug/metabolite transporter (DMT)-like permease